MGGVSVEKDYAGWSHAQSSCGAEAAWEQIPRAVSSAVKRDHSEYDREKKVSIFLGFFFLFFTYKNKSLPSSAISILNIFFPAANPLFDLWASLGIWIP